MVVIEKMGIARERVERAKYKAKKINHKRGIRISCSNPNGNPFYFLKKLLRNPDYS